MQRHIVHRHIKRSSIIIGVVACLLVAGYFFLAYRTAKIAELLVEQQSKGQFQLNLDHLDISVRNRRVQLTNASLQQIDTSTNAVKYTVRLPKLFLQLKSLDSLVFHKKLLIDSLSLISPSFETVLDTSASNNQITFQTAKIFEALQKTVELLNVRSFQLQNGSVILRGNNSSPPFEIHGIDFRILNFNRNQSNPHRFLSADEIELNIPRQQWKFSDNLIIKFSRLHFSGRKQSFRIDSCDVSSFGAGHERDVHVSADKISFSSDSLPAFYEKNELILDTLLCEHPVLRLHVRGNSSPADTAAAVTETLKKLFTDIHVKHLYIDDGQFTVENFKEGKSSTYTSQKTNIRIDDFRLLPNGTPFLLLGDIDMQLEELAFFTPDSLFQLTLDELDLLNNEIEFKNAWFGPSAKNPHAKSFSLSIPVLALHHLEPEELLKGHLGADLAAMYSPTITIESPEEKSKSKSPNENLQGFYEAIHGLSQLLLVKTLNVNNATIHFYSPKNDSLNLDVQGFTTSVALNNFLKSGSLVDLKHSVPYFQADQVEISSKKMKASLEDFHLHGATKHNGIKNIEVQLANGTSIEVNHFRWHHLDWDSLNLKHAILADSVTMDKLSINGGEYSNTNQQSKHDLPVIRIGKISADKFNIDYPVSKEGNVTAKGKNLLLSDVATSKNNFQWSDAQADFSSVKYKSPDLTAAVDKINFETPGKSKASGIEVGVKNETSTLAASLPEIKFQSNITSTDISILQLPSLSINQPQINFTQTSRDGAKSKSFKTPINLAIYEFKINSGQLDYRSLMKNDSTIFSAEFDVDADSISAGKKSDTVSLDKISAAFSNLSFSHDKLKAGFSALKLTMSDAKVFDANGLALQSNLKGNWNDGSLSMNFKKRSALNAENISGSLSKVSLDLKPAQKLPWKDWINSITISESKISFRDSANEFSFAKGTWDGNDNALRIYSFRLQPNFTEEQHFASSEWQSDYTKARIDTIELVGFDSDRWLRDSVLKIHRVNLSHAIVDVSRDKRIPFHHGYEKLMPTQLINSVHSKFSIDSVRVLNSRVTYTEYSNLTNRAGIIPIENINATLKKVTNDHHGKPDTLALKGKAQILSSHINKFSYKEAYDDSLSSFSLTLKMSPSEMTDFSRFTNPLAAVDISSGQFDTILARISGNKYASVGQMQFNYRDLKITLLNHQDTLSKRLSLSFVNFVANSFVIKSNNKKQSSIYFERDRERFVFNYWIKTFLSGVLTSAGIKSNKKYYKQYKQMKNQYSLPEANF